MGQDLTSAAAGAWQRRAVVRESRLFTRSLIVAGTLGLVFAWRVDRAIKTAYDSKWVAPETDGLRLPTGTWSWFYAAVGAASLGFLLAAALLWRRRERGAFFRGEFGRTSLVISVLVCVLAVGTAVARWLAADGEQGALTLAILLNILALSAVAALALATGNLVYGGLTKIVKGVIRRQRMNLVVVLALTVGLLFIGETSGQSIDSIRSWAPLVFDGGVEWSKLGAARLSLGLAGALLLALVVYESGVRLTQTHASLDDPPAKRTFRVGAALLVLGVVLLVALPFGPGLMLLGAGLVLVALLELPDLEGQPLPSMAPTRAEVNAPEWIAITPLLALASTSVTATVEASISGGADWNTFVTAAPALVLGLFAVLMTRRADAPTRAIEGVSSARLWAWVSVIVGASLLLVLFVQDLSVAAFYGLFWIAFLTYYAWRLFSNRPLWGASSGTMQPGWRAYSVAFALSGGLTAFIGIHVEPLEAGHLLGVFTLALIALAFALPLLRILVDVTLRLRPPRLLWWFGFNQLPVLTLILIWWIAVGIFQTHFGPTKSLHDVRLVERASAEISPRAAATSTPTLEGFFDEWVNAQQDRNLPATEGPLPLVLVAAHGGGIRAAYWTVSALDCLVGVSADGFVPSSLDSADESAKDETRDAACRSRRRTADEQRVAARRLFMASGVSGGAVGLYVYARQLLEDGGLGPTSDWVDDRLAGDFASPAIGWALFHDFPNRLLGLHPGVGAPCGWKWLGGVCLRQDRAAVLEETFDDKWDEADSPAAMLRGSHDLRQSEDEDLRERARLLPLLALNATLTGGNARAVLSAADLGSWPRADADDPERGNDRLPLAGTVEIRDALCETGDLRLSTAAFLAARFPYVTPSGHVPDRCGYRGKLRTADRGAACAKQRLRCEGRFVDGGYTDNSGLFTLVAVWPSLRKLIVDYNREARANGIREIAPMIIELDNHYRASLLASVPSGGSSAETLIPPQTAFGGRSAIETFARAAAYRVLPTTCTVTISPALHPGLVAPLGWELSETARADLRSGLTKPHPEDPKGMKAAEILRQVQARIAGPTEQKLVVREPFDRCLPRLPTSEAAN